MNAQLAEVQKEVANLQFEIAGKDSKIEELLVEVR